MQHFSITDLQITDATIEDLAAIVAIYNSTIPSRMVTADTTPVSKEEKTPWFYAHDSQRPLWIVEYHGQIIAWISFQSFYGRPAYQHTVEISIYIHEEYRGKGLGKLLLQYAIDQSPALDIQTILAYIFSHNTPSIQLFKQFGFEQYGYFPEIAVMDNNLYSLTILGLKVKLSSK